MTKNRTYWKYKHLREHCISIVIELIKKPFQHSLFVWGFSSHSKFFHSDGDVTITGEGVQILTYDRHSWPLRSEGSLGCHTYCDTGHHNNGHLLGPVTLAYCQAFGSGAVTICFGLSRLGFEHPTLRLQHKCSNPLHHRFGFNIRRSSWYNTHINSQFLQLFLWKWCSINTKQFDYKIRSVIESFLVAEHQQYFIYGAFFNSTLHYTWPFLMWTNIAWFSEWIHPIIYNAH